MVAVGAAKKLWRCGLMQHGDGKADDHEYAQWIKGVPLAARLDPGGAAKRAVHGSCGIGAAQAELRSPAEPHPPLMHAVLRFMAFSLRRPRNLKNLDLLDRVVREKCNGVVSDDFAINISSSGILLGKISLLEWIFRQVVEKSLDRKPSASLKLLQGVRSGSP
jgi:hypothetical protein